MIQTLSKQWRQLDLTVEQGIDLLSTLCAQKVSIHGKASFQTIPQPCDEVKTLSMHSISRCPMQFQTEA